MSLHIIDPSPLRQEPKPTKVRLHSTHGVQGVDSVHTPADRPSIYSCNFRVISDKLLADKRLSSHDVRLLLGLQKWGYGMDHCFPSIETIVKATTLSESTVRRSLKNLERLGLIRVEPDPNNATGRRIVRIWMSDPTLHPVKGVAPSRVAHLGCQPETPTLGVRLTDDLGCQPDGPPLGVSLNDKGTLLRELEERTTKAGSSSLTSVTTEDGQEQESDVETNDGGFRDYQVNEAERLAVTLWPGESPETLASKVKALCDDQSPRIALAALRATEVATKSKPRTWGYVLATARNMAREGGPITSTTTRPKVDPPKIVQAGETNRTRATVAEASRQKWEGWLKRVGPDLREAIEQADPKMKSEIMADIDRSNSPDFLEPAIRIKLGMTAVPIRVLLGLSRPAPAPPSPAELVAMGDTSWMQPA